MTTICFDFGNTRLKYGVFDDEQLIKTDVMADQESVTLNKILDEYKPERTVLSSVIHHDLQVENILASRSDLLMINTTIRLPFKTPVGKPADIGADRLAISAYACRYFPHQNNLIIAVGSAITYNFINKFHYFLGGGISPGMEMRFKSLHELTARLPRIQRNWEFPLIGYDTRTNILSGVMLGMAREISGIIEEYDKKFFNFNVLLTGGDTANFARHIKYKIFADPGLVLKGIYAISEYNHVQGD